MLESKYSPDRRILLRETFSDVFSVLKNNGIPSSTTLINDGRWIPTTTSGQYIKYPPIPQFNGACSLRIKLTKFVSTGASMFLLAHTNASVSIGTNGLVSSSGSSGVVQYQDGVQVSSFSFTTKPTELVITATDMGNYNPYLDLYLFTAANSAGQFQHLNGGECELFEIYNYKLSSTDVALIYSNNQYKKPRLQSKILEIGCVGNGIQEKIGLVSGFSSTANIKKYGPNNVIDCDANNIIQFNTILLSTITNKTIMFWIKVNSNSNANCYLYSQRNTDSCQIRYLVSSGSGYFNFTQNAFTNAPQSAAGSIAFGQWQRVVITVADTVCNFYINGVLSGTANQNAPKLVYSGAGTDTINSASRKGVFNLDGYTILDRVISQTEIIQDYVSGKALYGL